MPVQAKGIVNEWCPGWWPWQWFNFCDVEKWGWNYTFAPYEETWYGVAIKVKACENGVYYEFTQGGLSLPPAAKHFQPTVHWYEDKLDENGKCPPWFASQAIAVGTTGDENQPQISKIDHKRKTLQTTSVESGVYKYPPPSNPPLLMGPCRTGDWPYERILREEEVTLTVKYQHVQVQWSIGGAPVTDSGTASLGAYCHWPFPLLQGRSENRVVNVKYQLDNSQEGQSTLRLYNDPADGLFSIPVELTATAANLSPQSVKTSAHFEGEFCAFDQELLDEEQKCLKRVQSLIPQFVIEGHPTLWDIVSTPWDNLGIPIREEKHETVNQLLDIMKATYAHDANTFVWAADSLAQHTGISDVLSGLKFEPRVDGLAIDGIDGVAERQTHEG